jgi:hypothetical protein
VLPCRIEVRSQAPNDSHARLSPQLARRSRLPPGSLPLPDSLIGPVPLFKLIPVNLDCLAHIEGLGATGVELSTGAELNARPTHVGASITWEAAPWSTSNVGNSLGRFAISFRPPEELGLPDSRVTAGRCDSRLRTDGTG